MIEAFISEILPDQKERTRRETICYYCGDCIKPGEEIVNRGENKYYHRKCFHALFTLTSRCLTCANTIKMPKCPVILAAQTNGKEKVIGRRTCQHAHAP